MHSASFYEENMLSRPAILNCSFEELSTAKLPDHLYRIKPATRVACMRDSLMSSLGNLNKLHNILKMAGTTEQWRFFTLVFCSLEDKISNTTKKDFFSYTDKINTEWTVEQNKVVFIPIQMDESGLKDILEYCQRGGEKAEYFSTDLRNLSQVLKHIYSSTINSAKVFQTQRGEMNDEDNHAKRIEGEGKSLIWLYRFYCDKWEYLINTLCSFLEKLSPNTLINGIAYNYINLLAAEPPQSQINKKWPQKNIPKKQYQQSDFLPILEYPRSVNTQSIEMQYQPHYGYPLLGQHRQNNYAPKIQTNLIANQRNPILVVKIIGALVAFLAIGSLIYFVTL